NEVIQLIEAIIEHLNQLSGLNAQEQQISRDIDLARQTRDQNSDYVDQTETTRDVRFKTYQCLITNESGIVCRSSNMYSGIAENQDETDEALRLAGQFRTDHLTRISEIAEQRQQVIDEIHQLTNSRSNHLAEISHLNNQIGRKENQINSKT